MRPGTLPLACFSPQVSPGVIANPFAAGLGRRNSLESISSIDRELSPEGSGKVRATCSWRPPGLGSLRLAVPDWHPLCPQEKELPGQTPQWGLEAVVSVRALLRYTPGLSSCSGPGALGSSRPLPAGVLQATRVDAAHGAAGGCSPRSVASASPTLRCRHGLSRHRVDSAPQGRSSESLKLDYRTLAAMPGTTSAQRVSVQVTSPAWSLSARLSSVLPLP